MKAVERLLDLVMGKPPVREVYVQPGTYAPDEVPEYAFCESVFAGANSRWHIRKVTDKLYLTGGVNTTSLCGHVKPFGPVRGEVGGWDINVKITDRHLENSCPKCAEAYKEATSGTIRK